MNEILIFIIYFLVAIISSCILITYIRCLNQVKEYKENNIKKKKILDTITNKVFIKNTANISQEKFILKDEEFSFATSIIIELIDTMKLDNQVVYEIIELFNLESYLKNLNDTNITTVEIEKIIRLYHYYYKKSDNALIDPLLNHHNSSIRINAACLILSKTYKISFIKIINKINTPNELSNLNASIVYDMAYETRFAEFRYYFENPTDDFSIKNALQTLSIKKDLSFLDSILKKTNSNSYIIRYEALVCLDKLGHPKIITAIEELMNDNAPIIRETCCILIAKNKLQGFEDSLIERLQDNNWKVRISAARALRDCSQTGINILMNLTIHGKKCEAKSALKEKGLIEL